MNPALRRHTLGDLLRRSAARHPDKPAIACGEVRWTYREFDALCDRLAAGLVRSGVARGDRVAVLADALPKNPSGKLLKRTLREAHAGLFEAATRAP